MLLVAGSSTATVLAYELASTGYWRSFWIMISVVFVLGPASFLIGELRGAQLAAVRAQMQEEFRALELTLAALQNYVVLEMGEPSQRAPGHVYRGRAFVPEQRAVIQAEAEVSTEVIPRATRRRRRRTRTEADEVVRLPSPETVRAVRRLARRVVDGG